MVPAEKNKCFTPIRRKTIDRQAFGHETFDHQTFGQHNVGPFFVQHNLCPTKIYKSLFTLCVDQMPVGQLFFDQSARKHLFFSAGTI